MARHWSVRTPEGVEITYVLAGIGSRGGAVLVDHLLQITLMLALVFAAWALDYVGSGNAVLDNLSDAWATVIVSVLLFVCTWGYFVLFEWLANGQTPGKLMFGLRAVTLDGRPIDFFTSATRNLLRIADLMPGFYGVGLVSLFFSPAYRRIGDYGAGTIVVKEYAPERRKRQRGDRKHGKRVPVPPLEPAADLPGIGQPGPGLLTSRIERDEYQAARRFLDRRADLEPDIAHALAEKIAAPIMLRTGFVPDPGAPVDAETFLREVVDAYVRWQDLMRG